MLPSLLSPSPELLLLTFLRGHPLQGPPGLGQAVDRGLGVSRDGRGEVMVREPSVLVGWGWWPGELAPRGR